MGSPCHGFSCRAATMSAIASRRSSPRPSASAWTSGRTSKACVFTAGARSASGFAARLDGAFRADPGQELLDRQPPAGDGGEALLQQERHAGILEVLLELLDADAQLDDL